MLHLSQYITETSRKNLLTLKETMEHTYPHHYSPSTQDVFLLIPIVNQDTGATHCYLESSTKLPTLLLYNLKAPADMNSVHPDYDFGIDINYPY